MRTFVNWIGEWAETLRVAPPFTQRRRDLLATIEEANRDAGNPDMWVEVDRP